MTEPHPVTSLKDVMKKWQRIKDEIQDTECGGETWDYLADWNTETGTAQHALWRGCESIVKLCCEINEQINLMYPHPIKGCSTKESSDKVLDDTSVGVVLWSPAHLLRLIARLNKEEFEYLLSDIRRLRELRTKER